MQAAQALSANTTTFLTHIFGRGLADDRYVVERFHSRIDGDIRPVMPDPPKGNGGRGKKHAVVSLKTVKELRPGRNEIIICTGPAHQGRRPVLGGVRHGALPRPPAEGLSALAAGVRTALRRPDVLRLDIDTGREDTPMCDHDLEARRARDLERYHRRTAERRAKGPVPEVREAAARGRTHRVRALRGEEASRRP